MMRARSRRRLAIPIVLLIAITACADKQANIVTPEGKAAYTANEVLKRVENLQEAIIAAYRSGAILKSDAEPAVLATVNLAEAAESATQGWQALARQVWLQAKREIPVLQPGGKFSALAAAIDEVLP